MVSEKDEENIGSIPMDYLAEKGKIPFSLIMGEHCVCPDCEGQKNCGKHEDYGNGIGGMVFCDIRYEGGCGKGQRAHLSEGLCDECERDNKPFEGKVLVYHNNGNGEPQPYGWRVDRICIKHELPEKYKGNCRCSECAEYTFSEHDLEEIDETVQHNVQVWLKENKQRGEGTHGFTDLDGGFEYHVTYWWAE